MSDSSDFSSKIKAVIFDWAGTTIDFGSIAPVAAFVDLFKKFCPCVVSDCLYLDNFLPKKSILKFSKKSTFLTFLTKILTIQNIHQGHDPG